MTDNQAEEMPSTEITPEIKSTENQAAPTEEVLEIEEQNEQETTSPEQKPKESEKTIAKPAMISKIHKTFVPLPRDEMAVKVEKIMEEGLRDSFSRLSPVAQQEFKLKGEQTAGKIRELLKSAHVQAKKIFRLILEWLKMLPGINRFFLEQEAKIKTDRIIALKNKV